MNLGFGEILLILIIVLVLFGANKVPEVGRSLGTAMREFKKNLEGEKENQLNNKEAVAETTCSPEPQKIPDMERVGKIIEELRMRFNDFGLADEKQSEMLSDIMTIESQLKSSKPKQNIIVECLLSIHDILQEVNSNLIAAGFIYQIKLILSK